MSHLNTSPLSNGLFSSYNGGAYTEWTNPNRKGYNSMKKKHWTCNFYILLSWLTTTLTYKPVGVMHLTGCFSYRAPLTLLIPPSPPLTLSFLYEMEIHRNYEAKVLIRKIYKCCKYLVNDRYKGFFFFTSWFYQIQLNSSLSTLKQWKHWCLINLSS